MSRDAAPGRPFGRSGALFLALVLIGGCDAMAGGSKLALDGTEVAISGSVHEVRVSGAGARDTIAPGSLEAKPGDAVRFIVDDRRPHALTFTEAELEAPIRDYLDGTGQLRGPPLVNEGAEWVVVLEEAPPGRYPFHCRSHDAPGVLLVTAP